MTGENLQGDMMALKVWDPGTFGSLARPLSVRCHFFGELYCFKADENASAEFPLDSMGEVVRIIGKMSTVAAGEALYSFVQNELELRVRDEGCSIYVLDEYQLAAIDYISVDSNAASAYSHGGHDSLVDYCSSLERFLSEPFPRLEEIEASVFDIMGFLEPYQKLYPALKRVLGDKLGGEFESPEVARVYLTVADASLARDYERFRAEAVEPWLDMLHRALKAMQKPK